MKKLEELNISPLPWTLHERCSTANFLMNYGDQYRYISANGNLKERECVAAFRIKDGVCARYADACLLTEAPALFECLREAIVRDCINHDGDCLHCMNNATCQIVKWRNAIARASGEGEV